MSESHEVMHRARKVYRPGRLWLWDWRPWEARWFRLWAARTPRPRNTRTPSTLFISAPARGLAWILNHRQNPH